MTGPEILELSHDLATLRFRAWEPRPLAKPGKTVTMPRRQIRLPCAEAQ